MPATVEKTLPQRPTVNMRISPEARKRLRDTETVQYRYYNDMGKNRGTAHGGLACSLTVAFVPKKSLGGLSALLRSRLSSLVKSQRPKEGCIATSMQS